MMSSGAGTNTMLVEVWSDVMCPFCWLGKRRFTSALEQFENRERIEVIWRSFQLQPDLRTDPTIPVHQYLAREKGIDPQMARQMNERVAQMGRRDDLPYDFARVVVANTFDAHRVIHFAREHGRQAEAVERLFTAHFAEGRNMDDRATLIELGAEVGLDAEALGGALSSGAHAADVRADIDEAHRLGITGVPFFVLDRKFGVSGAQESAVFLQALERAFAEWDTERPEKRSA